jgi:hypothetical protein
MFLWCLRRATPLYLIPGSQTPMPSGVGNQLGARVIRAVRTRDDPQTHDPCSRRSTTLASARCALMPCMREAHRDNQLVEQCLSRSCRS